MIGSNLLIRIIAERWVENKEQTVDLSFLPKGELWYDFYTYA